MGTFFKIEINNGHGGSKYIFTCVSFNSLPDTKYQVFELSNGNFSWNLEVSL